MSHRKMLVPWFDYETLIIKSHIALSNSDMFFYAFKIAYDIESP